MQVPTESGNNRQQYERDIASLVGKRIQSVSYFDVHSFEDEPPPWDFGDWHLAVMGVELRTDSGPLSVIWTNRFYPYGVEVFESPMSDHLRMQGPNGPRWWSATNHSLWQQRVGATITGTSVLWESIAVQNIDPPSAEVHTHDVPAAVRIDFDAGPIWLVAAMPTADDEFFVMADEIIVVFAETFMRKLGLPSL